MPANLPPQYHEAERRYREARSIPEKIAALQEMLAIMPKHKGTDHLRGDLRARIAKLMDELAKPSGHGSARTYPFAVKKEGAGQVALVGLANVGKSALVATLTGATVKVADFPFTTQTPTPGMLRYENVRIQLIDTPPITDEHRTGPLYGLLRNADLLLLVVDLTDGPLAQAQAVMAKLEQWGFRLLGRGEASDPDQGPAQKPVVVAVNKADAEGTQAGLRALCDEYGERFPVVAVSALTEAGLTELGRTLFDALNVIRMYTKAPGREPDLTNPLVLPRGSTVADAAETVHKDWRQRLRYALLWGSGRFEAQRVGRDYVLSDGDVIELHG